MSKTDNLGLEIPSAADKHIFSTYKDNNELIDEAYGQYLEDQETSQENIAMIESHTAQSNHAIGSYFMLDNVLHKAISAIASGETITSGSNATPITLEQAITALNTSVQALQNLANLSSVSLSANHMNGGNTIVVYKRSAIASVYLSALKDITAGVENDLFILPTEYRPCLPQRQDITNPDGYHVRYIIYTNGAVTVYLYGSSNVSVLNVHTILTWIIG